MVRIMRENPAQIVWACGSYACLTLALVFVTILIDDSSGWLVVTGLTGTPLIAGMTSFYIRPTNSRTRTRAAAAIVSTNAGAVIVSFLLWLSLTRHSPWIPEGFTTSMIGATGVVAVLTAGAWVVCAYICDRMFVLLRRFPAPHECQMCGYDLTGNVSGVCPECGAASGR